ncbi:MAG: putative Ig domain-containing protein, partial [Candidatus Promineifilaceae bacterium]
LEVDGANGVVYWTETYDEHTEIWQSGPDGESAQALHVGDPQVENNPGAIVLDPADDRLYWSSGTVVVPLSGGDFIYVTDHMRSIRTDGTDNRRVFPADEDACVSSCAYTTVSMEGSSNDLVIQRIPGEVLETTDLQVNLTAPTDLAVANGTMTNTVTVENLGPLDAYDTVLTFELPSHTTANSFPGCTVVGTTATCDYGTLAVGQTVTLTAVLNVLANVSGRLVSTAEATTSLGDHVPANNVAALTAYHAPAAPTVPAGTDTLAFYADRTASSDKDHMAIYQVESSISVVEVVADGGEIADIVFDSATEQFYWLDVNSDVNNGDGTGILWRADADGANQTALLSNLTSPGSLILDSENGWLYWSDYTVINDETSGRIGRYRMTTGQNQVILEGVGYVNNLAWDMLRDRIYWSTTSGNVYYFDVLDGTEIQQVHIGLHQMDGLAVDPYRGRLYWGEYNYFGAIWQSDLDGSNISKLKDSLQTPGKLWYDLPADRLYFFDVSSCNFSYYPRLASMTPGKSGVTNHKCGLTRPSAAVAGHVVPPPVAPNITTSPGLAATNAQPYSYQPYATGSTPITWALLQAPAGMTISQTSGLVEWTPNAPGDATVEIEASNTAGSDTQLYTLVVSNPPPPEITSSP